MKRYIKADIVGINDEYWITKMDIACDPNTSPRTLTTLAKDTDTVVRREVAKNPNTPESVLWDLYYDKSMDETKIKAGVAENPNVPVEIIRKLCDDPYTVWEILSYIAQNPRTPIECIKSILQRYEDYPEQVKYWTRDKRDAYAACHKRLLE